MTERKARTTTKATATTKTTADSPKGNDRKKGKGNYKSDFHAKETASDQVIRFFDESAGVSLLGLYIG
jgi:hypothetical protein